MTQETEISVVSVDIGFDRTQAHLLHARCVEAGLDVQLILMDANGLAPGEAGLQKHQLLFRSHDRDAVRNALSDYIE